MNELCQKLETWGCDITGSMKRFLNDEEFYESCLKTLLEDDSFDLLGKAISEGNAPVAFEYVHSLKGSTANMGLIPVYKVIDSLTELLRPGKIEGADELYRQLMDKMTELEAIVKEYAAY